MPHRPLLFHLTWRRLYTKWRDAGEARQRQPRRHAGTLRVRRADRDLSDRIRLKAKVASAFDEMIVRAGRMAPEISA